MRKMLAVFKREYLSSVRKKMFIFMTLFFPVLMAGLFFIPMIVMARSLGGKSVAVIDGTGDVSEAFLKDSKTRAHDLPATVNVEYVNAKGSDVTDVAKPYLDRLAAGSHASKPLDAVLIVPAAAISGEKTKLTFYSRAATDLITQQLLGATANHEIQRQRLALRGIKPEEVEALTRNVPVEGVQLSRTGEQKKGGEANFMFAFLLAGLLIIPAFVYGLEIMRGIVQEKNDRVVEILISSMSPRELLTGKIAGVAAVGLTQVSVWLLILVAAGAFGATTAMAAGVNVFQFLKPITFVYFLVFFILGYLTYVCVYAVAGAACNSDKEAQQLMAPIQMVMMMPWFLMFPIITNPDSTLAVAFSLSPVFGPVTMFARTVASEPPLWHILLSIAISIVTIAAFFWGTAKIFRVGILSYGKRPTIPELWRWLRVA
ncbi:MAG TPA: ABC transporter permease [Thermoanaerobaculia bacterium]|nr:ABC transporter permease [Thermoanaerobaculia bacterium]